MFGISIMNLIFPDEAKSHLVLKRSRSHATSYEPKLKLAKNPGAPFHLDLGMNHSNLIVQRTIKRSLVLLLMLRVSFRIHRQWMTTESFSNPLRTTTTK